MKLLIAFLMIVPALARADVQSTSVSSKALFETLQAMSQNGGPVQASPTVSPGTGFSKLTLVLGSGSNSIVCRQEISDSGETTIYSCNLN